jgi:hypothetical protein
MTDSNVEKIKPNQDELNLQDLMTIVNMINSSNIPGNAIEQVVELKGKLIRMAKRLEGKPPENK